MENFINNTRQPFTVITNELLQEETIFNNANEKLCYLYLYSLKKCSSIFPSHETIAKAVCCSISTVKRILKELQKLKLLEIKNRPGHTSIYILNDYNEVVQNELGQNERAQDELRAQPNMNYEVAHNELLKLKDKNKIIKNIISSSDAREIIDKELSKKYSDRPFEEIKNDILNDETLITKTPAQYKAVLKYRLTNWKPSKKNSHIKNKTVIRKEMIPDWLHREGESQPKEIKMSDEDFEIEKLKLQTELKGLSFELKQFNH
ncbi:helix-turn-helix domain-containing protein [Priestia sp. P5]|uniref:helix-turn-helix domain-containing protein n=1 Tax=Priestia sp. P5 TaxID=2917806 RepID=UPI002404AEA4|nr:helix-turn-helix domain-containing protein [Priestia sp. P5]MDG0062100.1 helix-turn-helix domain-containing protein [Priestia sp. P5]